MTIAVATNQQILQKTAKEKQIIIVDSLNNNIN